MRLHPSRQPLPFTHPMKVAPMKPVRSEAPVSWWLVPTDRSAFDAAAAAEFHRMRWSRAGFVITHHLTGVREDDWS